MSNGSDRPHTPGQRLEGKAAQEAISQEAAYRAERLAQAKRTLDAAELETLTALIGDIPYRYAAPAMEFIAECLRRGGPSRELKAQQPKDAK